MTELIESITNLVNAFPFLSPLVLTNINIQSHAIHQSNGPQETANSHEILGNEKFTWTKEETQVTAELGFKVGKIPFAAYHTAS